MIKIDLITGFLGSGKTTFIKKYAQYLIDNGENICILENDFGAINVDMMLLSDLQGDNCELEMVSGGCDKDCHKRRFKTKLISMGMCGYTRVLVEPSGIFDTDEFFDTLKEEPLDKWYEIGSVISIVDPAACTNIIDDSSKYLLASEMANAGIVIISKLSNNNFSGLTFINSVLAEINCNRIISENDILAKSWDIIDDSDFSRIKNAGYKQASYVKRHNIEDKSFESMFFMNEELSKLNLERASTALFNNTNAGNIIRIKGFYKEDNLWFEFNATENEISESPVTEGQDVVIIIGNELKKELITNIFLQK